jgi:hypothetical protein
MKADLHTPSAGSWKRDRRRVIYACSTVIGQRPDGKALGVCRREPAVAISDRAAKFGRRLRGVNGLRPEIHGDNGIPGQLSGVGLPDQNLEFSLLATEDPIGSQNGEFTSVLYRP